MHDGAAHDAAPARPAPEEAMRAALLESRERWRGLVALGSDFVFETDAAACFTFLFPDQVLGWSAAMLIGQPAELLLGDAGTIAFNPFRSGVTMRRRRAWLRRADGSSACVEMSVAPLPAGGVRGCGQDRSLQEREESQLAATLRRGEVIDDILNRMRQEVLAPRMMASVLEGVTAAVGAEGSAVIDLLGDGVQPAILHHLGPGLAATRYTALSLLEECEGASAQARTPDGRRVLVCPTMSRVGERAGLALWREAAAREWDTDDTALAIATTGLVRVILDHEAIQQEMALQARTDPLTGLLNRRAFLEEIGRRLERLEREGMPGTLMFVDLDHFKALNDRSGHDAGDEALTIAATLLRATFRPSDLVARLGGDEFALWLDGADDLIAAERAEALRLEAPDAFAHLVLPGEPSLSMSIGIATRWPGRGEDIETLLHRADVAMYEVKRAGRGHWRVARADSTWDDGPERESRP